MAFFAPIFWGFVAVYVFFGAILGFLAYATVDSAAECSSLGRRWLILGLVNMAVFMLFGVYFAWRIMQRGFRAYTKWIHQDAVAMLSLWFLAWHVAWMCVAGWLHYSGKGGEGQCLRNLGISFWLALALTVIGVCLSVAFSMWYRNELEGYDYERRRGDANGTTAGGDLTAGGMEPPRAMNRMGETNGDFQCAGPQTHQAASPPSPAAINPHYHTGVAPAPSNPHFQPRSTTYSNNGATTQPRTASFSEPSTPFDGPAATRRPAEVETPRATAEPTVAAPAQDTGAQQPDGGGNVVSRGAAAVVSGVGSIFGWGRGAKTAEGNEPTTTTQR